MPSPPPCAPSVLGSLVGIVQEASTEGEVPIHLGTAKTGFAFLPSSLGPLPDHAADYHNASEDHADPSVPPGQNRRPVQWHHIATLEQNVIADHDNKTKMFIFGVLPWLHGRQVRVRIAAAIQRSCGNNLVSDLLN